QCKIGLLWKHAPQSPIALRAKTAFAVRPHDITGYTGSTGMTQGYEQIQFTLDDGVGVITLNRPDRLNSFTAVMHGELARALDTLEACDALRGLVITGAGRGFCAGQDLGERKPLPEGQRRDLSEGLRNFYRPLIL